MIATRRAQLLVALLWIAIGGYVAYIAWEHVDGARRARSGDTPLYTDYTPFYAASLQIRAQPAENLYIPRQRAAAERDAAQVQYPGISPEQARAIGFDPWMHPPTFILLVAPLAYLPYLLSWLLWLAATAAPYLAAIRRILPARLAWPFALAAPPTFFNVMYGQTGFLTAGLIGLGLALLDRRPHWAGVLIGLASFKPHFGVLIPIALAAGGQWRAFGSAALTVIGFAAVSVVAFGDDPWFGFIGTALFLLDGFGAGAYNFNAMTTVLATLRLAGAAEETAWLAQCASAALMVALVAWAWWRGRARRDTLGLQSAILCLATPLALPMTYLYDLVLIVPAAAWIWADQQRRGARRGEYALLLGSLAALLATKVIAQSFGVQVGILPVATMLALAVQRYRHALASEVPPAEDSIR